MSLFNGISISGLAVAVPGQLHWVKDLLPDTSAGELKRIMQTTGISRVRLAPPGVCASDLCQAAAEALLEQMDLKAGELDAIVFVSQTPDFILPATSCVLQHRLGMREDVAAFDINYGCSGFVYGLLQAAMLITCGMAQRVLLLAGDVISARVNPRDKALRVDFGDGGSACVVSQGEGAMVAQVGTDGSGWRHLVIPAGGCRRPMSRETARVEADKHGNARSENDVYMNGMEVMKFALSRVPKMFETLLHESGWQRDEVDCLALNQTNQIIIDYLNKKIKMPRDKVPVHLESFGNTGSASIPLALVEHYTGERPPDKTVMIGFGVGLSWAGATCSLAHTRIAPLVVL